MYTHKSTYSPLVARDLEEVEEAFSFKFPRQVFDFYLKFNGGRPEKDRFVDEGKMCAVDEFLPIKFGPPRLTFEATMRRVQHLLPHDLIPLAVGPFGDFFCFSTSEREYGAMYIFRAEERPTSRRRMEWLSSSFSEFVLKLTSKEAIVKPM